MKLRGAFYLIVFALMCCTKPYNPKVVSSPGSYLVVEGVIDSGNDSTIIKLSKTVKLSSKTTVNPVLGATVKVESDQNNSYPLLDVNGNGYYKSPALGLQPTQRYRLRISTSDGNQYLSDFIAVKPTPPIDSVGYVIQNNNVQLYVNTHDPANKTLYYRWVYNETWMFNAEYKSTFVLDTAIDSIVMRPPEKDIYSCFGNDTSLNILVNSTTKLASDVVYQSPLTLIPITSEKFETKYSILVKQYALTEAAYTFYQNLKKNTEQLGGIFDAEPSEVSGNIHNVNNPGEPVIGYLSVTNAQSKRIFLDNSILPKGTRVLYPYDCEENKALYREINGINGVLITLIRPPLTAQPTLGIYAPNGVIIGYRYSTPICTDCTLRGVKKAPAFWQ